MMGVAHRIEQILDRQGEAVTISKRTEGSADDFNAPKYSWADEATENAIVTVSATAAFAQLAWVYAGELKTRDRIGYFKQDSVIAENKRVVLQSGERYEVSIMDQPILYGEQCLKVVILKRLMEQ